MMKSKIFFALLLLSSEALAQVTCRGPIPTRIILTQAQTYDLDVDGDMVSDYQFGFSGTASDYQFDLRPLGGEEIQTCDDLGLLFACAYPAMSNIEDIPFANDLHLLAGQNDFGSGSEMLGNFFSGIRQYIVYRIGSQRGWIEIYINDISGAQVDFNIGIYAIETVAGVDPLITGDCSVLPIEFGDLIVEEKPSGLEIRWEVISSIGVDRVYIERSSEGLVFDRLDQATYDNNGTQGWHQWLDHKPYPGRNYYRLEVLDLDGTQSFSEIASELWQNNQLSVYPNPVQEDLFISAPNLEKPTILTVYNQLGKLVKKLTLNSSLKSVDLSELQRGSYHLHLSAPGSSQIPFNIVKI
jgi:hypothetical protein